MWGQYRFIFFLLILCQNFIKIRIASVIVFLCFLNETCQDTGHLSYACPKNMLGEREPPKKKEKKKKKKAQETEHMYVFFYGIYCEILCNS